MDMSVAADLVEPSKATWKVSEVTAPFVGALVGLAVGWAEGCEVGCIDG
jgi:hypothetical protein